jgi:DNA-binding NarL/FixJ family response regulator
MTSVPLSIAIVDRQLTFADGVATRLLAQDDVGVTAAYTSIDALLIGLERDPVDVVLLDWVLCDSYADCLSRVEQVQPGIHLLCSGERDPHQIAAALRAGALGWVPKDLSFDKVLDGIRVAARGERWVPPELLGLVLEAMSAAEPTDRGEYLRETLTRREHEVLQCMVDGMSRNEVAEHLGMSPNTVRTHVQSLLHKLGVHSSLRAVAIAREAGLVSRNPSVPQQRARPDRDVRQY